MTRDDEREILLALVAALVREAGDRAERALARSGEDALGRRRLARFLVQGVGS
jgi:hypothetical protein